MAPGLNCRQVGCVPKSKSRNSGGQSHTFIRDNIMPSTSSEWEPVPDQNSRSRFHRKISSTHSETEADSIRHEVVGMFCSTKPSKMHVESNLNEDNGQDVHGNRARVFVPDKKQVINKITQIQDYIQQTATLMNALKSSDCPEKKKQYEKLAGILEDLKDSESKLIEMLKNLELAESKQALLTTPEVNQDDSNNNSDNNEEDLIRRTEESKKKLELLQKRKQELIELQEEAMKQLQEAQMEQSRLVARASSLNQDINSNRFLDLNVQLLSQRLKTAQQLCKTSNQINESLADNNRESNVEEAEHPDEDQTEMSDTEIDFQVVSDKVAEINMMKAQLAQIRKIMASISLDSSARDSTSTPTEMPEDRKDQMSVASQLKSSRNESVDESSSNALKLEQARVQLSQLTQLFDMAQSAQGSKTLPSGYAPVLSTNEEGASARRSPSPNFSGKCQQRPSDEMYVETMQLMTRELEERTVAMKEEHEKLVAARQELENLAKKIPLVNGERGSVSMDDSRSETPGLISLTLDSSGRFVNTNSLSEQQSPHTDRSFNYRSGHSKSRQRNAWESKNEEITRSLQHINALQNSVAREHSRWSPSPSVSFCDNASCSTVQNPTDKSSRMGGDGLVPRPVRPDEITVEELYAQHQMLIRTVARCSHLLLLQQKQIIELRNTLMLQQSTMFQNMIPPAGYGNQPQRNPPFPPHLYHSNPMPNMPFPMQPPPMSISQQEQNYLSPNQTLKLNSMPNIQTYQDFNDQYYQGGTPAGLPFDILDYQFRYGNYNRSNPQHLNSNSNVNQNLNQGGASGLNNRIPVGGMSCLGPEDSGALNNQVPPGNRANNYWDNFRSYSRQNLLSHSKSNEDTDTARRASTAANQERPIREASSSMTIQNNVPPVPSHETGAAMSACGAVDASEYDGCHTPQGQSSCTLLPNHVQVSRSRSAEIQSHRKNDSRNQENDSRNLNPKNEPRGRNPEMGAAENIRSVRNDVNQCGRNLAHLVRGVHNDVCGGGINKKRVEKSRSRNEGRGNLNNRASTNAELPVILRENVYSEVTNFIRANENRPHFLIQLFRDLQQVTTDPLRQRTLESIQEAVNVNNLAERSNIDGPNLNIIDNRNNIRENRSNLNRNQGDDPGLECLGSQARENQNANRQNVGVNSASACGGNDLESIQEAVNVNNLAERSNIDCPNLNVIDNRNNIRENRSNLNRNQGDDPGLECLGSQARENQNANRQNVAVNSASACGGGNDLENPNISNIRNLGSSRSNLENDGLRDLRTYYEANLCNFGHNSALENPNLSNIRENLTRRGTPGDLDNANPKNLYLSMYDNVWRRNQESHSGAEGATPFSHRNLDQYPSDNSSNGSRGSNSPCCCNNHPPAVAGDGPVDVPGDGNFPQNRQLPPAPCGGGERDSKYVNVSREVCHEDDSQMDSSCNSEGSKRSVVDVTVEGSQSAKKEAESCATKGSPVRMRAAPAAAAAQLPEENHADEEGAVALPPEWARPSPENRCCVTPVNHPRGNRNACHTAFYEDSDYSCFPLTLLDNGDLAEADQPQNEEASGSEASGWSNNVVPSVSFSDFASDGVRTEENSEATEEEYSMRPATP